MPTDQFDELGPIDVALIAYPSEGPLAGDALPVFFEAVDRGVVTVFDVLFVVKGDDGTVSSFGADEVDATTVGELIQFAGASSGILDEDDAAVAAGMLEKGEAGMLLMYENRWAAPFVTSVRSNGGHLVASQRIAASDVLDALDRAEAN